MRTNRELIWDMVSDLLPEHLTEQMCLCEGVKKWEDEVKDIVDSVESLAITIEHHLEERNEYLSEKRKGE